jgi:hypothetical protein
MEEDDDMLTAWLEPGLVGEDGANERTGAVEITIRSVGSHTR